MGAPTHGPYRRNMVTLHIEHPITDFATWRTAFGRFAEVRRNAGVTAERIMRPVDEPHYIVVALDFDSAESAGSFKAFLESQVWSSPANAPGLDGHPRTMILEPAPIAAD